MEKFRKMVQPDAFSLLKVSKHSSEVIRFDAELENRGKLERVMSRLDNRVVQLNDYPDSLKVRVSEAKCDFPSRHSWDSFFRDSTDMDEMKPGERPDTIHIENLPIRWFVHEKDHDDDAPPSESLFRKVFEKFGSIRQVDIPAADPFRMQMKTTMRGITTPPQDSALYFNGYVQFSEYVGFVRCMDALRGRKLLRKRDDLSEWCGIRVDFDKTKHMTDAAVKRRAIVRERLIARQQNKEEEERQEKEKVNKRQAKERLKAEKAEQEKLQKMREREERRKKKQLAKLMQRDDVDVNGKVAEEHRKLLKAQKKLQAIRLLEELFMRIELRPELQHNGKVQHYHASMQRVERARFVENFKRRQEDLVDSMRHQFKHALDGRVIIRTALDTKKQAVASSISSISSDEDAAPKKVKTERLTTPEREMEYNKATGVYGIPPYGFGYPFPPVPPGYPYPPQTSLYYPVRGAYYPEGGFGRRGVRGGRGGRGGRGRGCRMPYFEGPDASHQYYLYFKKLTQAENRNDHDDRGRSRSRSRRRSYSRSRSRSRSRRRSYSRSRSRSRRSRSRRSRSRSRRSRSRSRRSRSHHSRSRSRSRKRSKSRSRRSKSRSRSKDVYRTPPHSRERSVRPDPQNGDNKMESPSEVRSRERSKSWSLPKEDQRKSWSKSPKEK
ncbi:A-kinase anchor protein 17A isoform X2 [Achroia grisella]|nr:A-kinase anchor protein 17A isoform X2 [Achroia grisella]